MKRLALVFACSVGGAAVAMAADVPKESPAKVQEKVSGPRIIVEPSRFHFGKALQNKTLTKEFIVRNMGTEDLVINHVSSSCGCTVAQLVVPKTLKPGASTPLTVAMETRTSRGTIKKDVALTSNDPVQKTLRVEVSADVESNTGTGQPLVPSPR